MALLAPHGKATLRLTNGATQKKSVIMKDVDTRGKD
jgi:hypothetical protein